MDKKISDLLATILLIGLIILFVLIVIFIVYIGSIDECEHLKGKCEYFKCKSNVAIMTSHVNNWELKYQNCLLEKSLNE